MAKTNKLKIFNDPIYGFIGTPNELIFNLVNHSYFQRLRRISQMGLSYLVYPGAHHTRFHHALGSMHLMRQSIDVLRLKGIDISDQEANGLLTAILLHDIGHGPFSHALEGIIVQEVSHEKLSQLFMERLNDTFSGELDLALSIFKGEHPRPFFNQLVSSQLDMDRLDYLRRDSFFTGVAEGNISSQRIISMLNVYDGELVVEEKGIYSVEKFLMARRFMYWQVYLHKTSLVAELLLKNIVARAKQLIAEGEKVNCPEPLQFFLENNASVNTDFDLDRFALLDDIDIQGALKGWMNNKDNVLQKLSRMLLDRRLLRIKLKRRQITQEEYEAVYEKTKSAFGFSEKETQYFVLKGSVSNTAYNSSNQPIKIVKKSGKLVDVTSVSDHFNLQALSKKVSKYYLCFPKEIV